MNGTLKTTLSEQHYVAYGLTFRSELPMPDVPVAQASGPADVVVRRANLRNEEFEAVDRGVFWKTAPGQFRIDIDDIASYLVRDGREILVDAFPTATEIDVAQFLMGSVTGALLHQRGDLPLHASAVKTDSGAVLFVGQSGAGKSTLMTGLNRRGYDALCDDISAISQTKDGNAVVRPAIPRTKVCEDAAEHFGIETDGLVQVMSRRKFISPVARYATETTPLRHIFFIGFTDKPQAQFEDVSGSEAIRLLTHGTYRWKFMKGMGVQSRHFPLLSAITKTARVTLLRRPERLTAIENTLDQLEAILK